jgi:hypothetical protein
LPVLCTDRSSAPVSGEVPGGFYCRLVAGFFPRLEGDRPVIAVPDRIVVADTMLR